MVADAKDGSLCYFSIKENKRLVLLDGIKIAGAKVASGVVRSLALQGCFGGNRSMDLPLTANQPCMTCLACLSEKLVVSLMLMAHVIGWLVLPFIDFIYLLVWADLPGPLESWTRCLIAGVGWDWMGLVLGFLVTGGSYTV